MLRRKRGAWRRTAKGQSRRFGPRADHFPVYPDKRTFSAGPHFAKANRRHTGKKKMFLRM
jgi:hypothetical protein